MQLRTENNIQNVVFVDDGYEKTLDEEDKRQFEKFLPLAKRNVKAADQVSLDEVVEIQQRKAIKLYRCSDNDGKYRVVEVKTGPLEQSDLDSDDVFILDHGHFGIWVWVGKKASDKERIEAMRNARGFVKKKKYPPKTAVTRVIDGAEPIEFKSLFKQWTQKDETKGYGQTHQVGKVAQVTMSKFDASTMHERPALAAEVQLVDDGNGNVKMWRIRHNEEVEINSKHHGTFFNKDCYIVSYSYRPKSGEKHIIYFWQGLHSTQEERGVAAYKTVEKDFLLGGIAVQVRVVQGHEPCHFMQMFKGKMTIFNGKGTDFDSKGQNALKPKQYLLQVQGTATYNTKATEVPRKATSLNSNYCFIAKSEATTYVWCGNYTTGDQKEMAKNFMKEEDFHLLREGSEPAEFWNLLGGKAPYMTLKLVGGKGDKMPPRLFQCSTATGTFRVEEIMNFVQTDLAPEDVMLLDAHDTIFIWIGNLSTKEEQNMTMELATEYLKTDPSGRNVNTSTVVIKQGNEPPIFTGFFGVWDQNLWQGHSSYEKLRDELENAREVPKKGVKSTVKSDFEFNKYHKYPVSVLKGPAEELPSSVDALKKELHLTHDDFVSIFKMDYQQFQALPKWKQQEQKKKVGLF